MQNKLYIAYFINSTGERDATTFVSTTGDIYDEFMEYANKYQDWDINADDIVGIYQLNEEEDKQGNKYQVAINK